MSDPRQVVTNTVTNIKPFDDLETEHRQKTLEWIRSGAPLFRISKPDNPFQHLVSYFILFDEIRHEVMLIDHIKAQCWVPTGGHVHIDEDPSDAVIREADEELKMVADFSTSFGKDPLFVTLTTTKGYGNHTDVSLWYVVKANSENELWFNTEEMNAYRWLSFDTILATDINQLDPHLHRFINKMKQRLA